MIRDGGRALAVVCLLATPLIWPGLAHADHDGFPHSPGDPSRGYELVSPPDKPSGIGVGVTYQSPLSMAPSGTPAQVADRFAVEGSYGSMITDGAFAFANDFAFSDRVGDVEGWVSHSPITHPLHEHQPTRFVWPLVATADYRRLVWQGNGGWPIFPELGGTDTDGIRYISDWGSPPAAPRWEMFNATDPAQLIFIDGGGGDVASALSGDGAAGLTSAAIHGLGGPGDPALLSWGDRLAGGSVYRVDLSGELTDAYPASDVADRYELVNTCAGAGADRTRIPQRLADGTFGDQTCPDKLAGRDERLVSSYGASVAVFNASGQMRAPVNAISNDGTRAFFMAPDPAVGGASNGAFACAGGAGDVGAATKCPAQVYVRQRNPGGGVVVRWLSKPEAGLLGDQLASLLGPAVFEGASADGDKVFFRTTSPLTGDDPNAGCAARQGAPLPCTGDPSGAQESSWDLYMYDLADGPDPTGPGSSLTRISAGPTSTGDCNNPQGSLGANSPVGSARAASLRFASEDGSRVYFACSAPLTGAVLPSEPGRVTVPGGDPSTTSDTNLYFYDADLPVAQRWRFVARIPRAAGLGAGTNLGQIARACASTGFPVGSPVSFGSSGEPDIPTGRGRGCVNGSDDGGLLTFWTTGRLTADDADDGAADIYAYDADTDELVRITAPDVGPDQTYQCVSGQALMCHGDPGYIIERGNHYLGLASDPATPGERIAFFQSKAPLVAEDSDTAYDLYEWRDGELSLISTGQSAANDGAIYKGNSADGRNVYFATRDALTWQDHDAVADVYVARTGSTGVSEPVVPAVCAILADACQPPTQPFVASSLPKTVSATRDDGADVGPRKRLALGAPSLAQRRRAARAGVLGLRVRSNRAGPLRLVARGRIGKRMRRVGGASKTISKPGAATMRIRLSDIAREHLRSGHTLSLSIQLRSAGARPKSVTVVLRRAGK